MGKRVTYLDLNNPILEQEQMTTANLGALYIISALENRGYEVDYRDYQVSMFAHSLKIKDIVTFAKDCEDILMICCMAYMLPNIILAAKEIKEINPNIKILLGGAGPTGVAQELVKNFPFIDIVMCGEGESTVCEVMDTLFEKSEKDELEKIKGIVFQNQKGEVVKTAPRERNQDLDSIAFPAYHKIDMTKYKEFGLVTGRGCAYKCKFCDIHGLWKHKYLQRSLDNVFEELRILVNDYGVKQIRIWDDTFTMSEKRIMEFCKRIKEEKLEFSWSCFGRVNLVNERLLECMRDAGCKGMFFGLESGSEKILDEIEKKITVDTMIRAIDLTKKYMHVKGHLIWGFPFETNEDLYQTIYLYNYLKTKMDISVGQLWPYPTSPLYQEYKEITRFNPYLGSFHNILPFKEDEVEDERRVMELISKYPSIFTQFYYFHTDNFVERYDMMKNLDLIC